jgi:hypothetical protein
MQAAGGSRRWACGLHNTGTNRSIDPSESQSERGSGRAPPSINITRQKPESTSGRAARRRVDLASFMYGESYLSALLRQSYLIDQPANRRVATNDLHTVSRRRMAVPSRRGRLKNKSAALEFRSWLSWCRARTVAQEIGGPGPMCRAPRKSAWKVPSPFPVAVGGLTCGVPAMRQPGALPACCA